MNDAGKVFGAAFGGMTGVLMACALAFFLVVGVTCAGCLGCTMFAGAVSKSIDQQQQQQGK